MFFRVKTRQVLEGGDWKLDIKISCEIKENEMFCKKKLESI